MDQSLHLNCRKVIDLLQNVFMEGTFFYWGAKEGGGGGVFRFFFFFFFLPKKVVAFPLSGMDECITNLQSPKQKHLTLPTSSPIQQFLENKNN